METKHGHDRMILVALYEAIGTTLLTYCILVSSANPIAASLGLFSMILIFGDVTGGHYNPAVTLGVMIWQSFQHNPIKNLILSFLMIVAQCLGAMAGALISSFMLSVDGEVPEEYITILAPQNTVAT